MSPTHPSPGSTAAPRAHAHDPAPPGYQAPADARCAASLLLLRDGEAGLEVLMLRRAEREGDTRSGVAVFPGGVLDPRDRDAHAHCQGWDDAQASRQLGLLEGGLDYAVAAVRETFEEVGVLLTDRQPQADARQHWRGVLHRAEAGMADLCRTLGLQLDLRGWVYFSHWLTPPGAPKRFDTRFFATRAPADQTATADLGEAVALMWLTPAQALDPALGLKLLPVTSRTLQELATHDTVDAVLQAAAARPQVERVMPRRARTASGPTVVLPDQPAYAEVARLDPDGLNPPFADLVPGRVVDLSPRVRRVIAPNPGMMTGPGTNTYLVASPLPPTAPADAARDWTVIDPGPDDPDHLRALQHAAAPGRIVQILVTHTHRDHSPAAGPLARLTGATVCGRLPDHAAGQDPDFRPDRQLQDGERLVLGPGGTLRVVHTPGHASNHLCFLLEEEQCLFTGDHVMQGSTVVINPPDGDMAVYLASLQALLAVPLQCLAPGHGWLVDQPHRVVQGLIAHRLRREAKVVAALAAQPAWSPQALVQRVYDDVPSTLHGVAARSLLAHLLKLQAEGRVAQDDGRWRWQG